MAHSISPTSTLAPMAHDAPSKTPSALDMEKGQAFCPYDGEGTEEKPFIVKYLDGEAANPQNWSAVKKWTVTAAAAFSTLVVAFASSLYSGGLNDIMVHFEVDTEVATLGLTLFVLGFAFGPLLWAPFSEQYGRRAIFIPTYFLFALFHIPCALAKNIETLLICRFLAGFFGSAPLTNSGGIISDIFSASDRALGMSIFALAPFAGPVLGPIIGGFMGENISWRWIFWLLTIVSFVMWALQGLVPETYAPVLLRRRAAKLSKETGKVYRSMFDMNAMFSAPFKEKMKAALLRPFVLLFKESIVLLFSIYAAFVFFSTPPFFRLLLPPTASYRPLLPSLMPGGRYKRADGLLYLFFTGFPYHYQLERGWSPGIGGLPFLSVGIGMLLAVIANIYDNSRYKRQLIAAGGSLPPEARLPLCMIGGVVLALGLFIFAWTTRTDIHYMVSIVFAAPFGFGMVAIFLSMMSYLVDAYLFLAASALAANAFLRSLFGFAFPMFGKIMFSRMGTNWALTLCAFVALALAPVPFAFFYYGDRIRANSTFAPGHKPAPAPAPAAPAAEGDLQRKPTRQEEEAEDIANLDLAQVQSRHEERVKEAREGVLNEEAVAEAERTEREERQ